MSSRNHAVMIILKRDLSVKNRAKLTPMKWDTYMLASTRAVLIFFKRDL